MRILYYIHHLNTGGAETVSVQNLIRLKKMGHEVCIVVNSYRDTYLKKQLDNNGIRIICLYPEYKDSILGKLSARIIRRMTDYKRQWDRVIEDIKPDIIHLNTVNRNTHKIDYPFHKVIITLHTDYDRLLKMNRYAYRELRFLSDSGASFFCLTSRIMKDITSNLGTKKTYFVPNGVDLSDLNRNAWSKKRVAALIKVPESSYIIGHVGRFAEVKNHMFLISLFQQIHRNDPNTYLIMCGGGDDTIRKKIIKRIHEDGLEKSVFLLGEREDAKYMAAGFDCLVLPSKREGFPITLIEAEANSVRCVASDAIPDEAVCRPNCYRLSLDSPLDEWEKVVIGKKNPEVQVFTQIENLDTGNICKNMVNIYTQIAVNE